MRHATRLLPALLLLLCLPACDSGGDEEGPAISGEWSGDVVDPNTGNAVSMSFVLIEDNGDVAGNGEINLGGGTASMGVSGTYDYPDVELTFVVQNPDPTFGGFDIDFDGEMRESGDVMEGTVQVEGATGEGEVRFVRED